MTQGERVQAIRKTLGLTLDKFGESLGLKKFRQSNRKQQKQPYRDKRQSNPAYN